MTKLSHANSRTTSKVRKVEKFQNHTKIQTFICQIIFGHYIIKLSFSLENG